MVVEAFVLVFDVLEFGVADFCALVDLLVGRVIGVAVWVDVVGDHVVPVDRASPARVGVAQAIIRESRLVEVCLEGGVRQPARLLVEFLYVRPYEKTTLMRSSLLFNLSPSYTGSSFFLFLLFW